MAKVTTKLQVTVPKAIADRFGIRPGDEIEWRAEGNAIRVLTRALEGESLDREARLRSFDEATARQKGRNRSVHRRARKADRGWTREDLYDRVRPR
jgi:AbrB family looped-hinge helix DNA binding protein